MFPNGIPPEPTIDAVLENINFTSSGRNLQPKATKGRIPNKEVFGAWFNAVYSSFVD